MAPSKRILLVDDEATLAFFLQQSLKEAGYMVDVAASGEEALNKLTIQTPYDLLITDLRMSGISGFTLLRAARSLYPDIKAILITAFGSNEVESFAGQLEVDAYLTKPFSTAHLEKLADSVLAGAETGLQSTSTAY